MEKTTDIARQIVQSLMYQNDAFSQWLGIEILDVKEGYCALSMTVRKDMTNGFGISHGGIIYAFADSALAFASNSYGEQALSIETQISHVRKVNIGDVLHAVTIEKHKSRRFAIYEVEVKNQGGELVGLFKGTVYKTGNNWDLSQSGE
ncbi:MAG: hydroxyphenylacetyl-CoA thioesterase PaaI [Saprospiraceae bacterium]